MNPDLLGRRIYKRCTELCEGFFAPLRMTGKGTQNSKLARLNMFLEKPQPLAVRGILYTLERLKCPKSNRKSELCRLVKSGDYEK
jgi:hypothetical protein